MARAQLRALSIILGVLRSKVELSYTRRKNMRKNYAIQKFPLYSVILTLQIVALL